MTAVTEPVTGVTDCPCASAPALQTFDTRQPVIVRPSEIRAGDYLRDLGRLRRVARVETTDDPISPNTVAVRFDDDSDGQYGSLTVRGTVDVIVWRMMAPGGLQGPSQGREPC